MGESSVIRSVWSVFSIYAMLSWAVTDFIRTGACQRIGGTYHLHRQCRNELNIHSDRISISHVELHK
jgi:hypothetical protein